MTKTILFLIALICHICLIPRAEAQEIDIQAIIQIESKGNPHAVGKDGEIGLMQVSKKALADWNTEQGKEKKKILKEYEKEWEKYEQRWAKSYEDLRIGCRPPSFPFKLFHLQSYVMGDMYDPVKNVRVGRWYINTRIPQMFKAYGIEDTVEARLIAYNYGIGNLLKHIRGKALPKETRAYIAKYRRLTK